MADIVRKLDIEAETALHLRNAMQDILGNDEEMIHDAVEGQTNLLETIDAAVTRCNTLTAFEEAIDLQIKRLKDRKDRFTKQKELIRAAIHTAMQQAGLPKCERAHATITIKKCPQKVEVVAEADIPAEFWKAGEPKLDKVELLKALKNKEVIAGVKLSDPETTLEIRQG
jgi:hypothetical protein